MYKQYSVYNHAGERIGSVSAQSDHEAVYRLVGGEWGRSDYMAYEPQIDPNEARIRAINDISQSACLSEEQCAALGIEF